MADVIRGFSYKKGANFTPYEGAGGGDCVAKDGFFAVTLTGSATYDSKENKKPMIRVHAVISDEDFAGARVVSNLHLDGDDSSGNWLGRQFLEFQTSMQTTLESIHKSAKDDVTIPDANAVVKAYIEKKRTGYVELVADVYDGNDVSRCQNWVTKERYEQAKAVGAHRRPRKNVGVAPSTSAGAAAGALGGPSANGATAGAPAAAVSGESLPML